MKIAKIDRALTRNPNSRVEVLPRGLLGVLVGDDEGVIDGGAAGDWEDMVVNVWLPWAFSARVRSRLISLDQQR